MATNLAISEELMNTALKLGGYRSKKDTVNAALEEFIRRRKGEDIIDLFGTVKYHDDYDYKTMRNRQ